MAKQIKIKEIINPAAIKDIDKAIGLLKQLVAVEKKMKKHFGENFSLAGN